MDDWSPSAARRLAAEYLGGLGDRWHHVQAVGAAADLLVDEGLAERRVAAAAWLHDLGYAEPLAVTGFHALDGARVLNELGAPDDIVALVAFHTGAEFEAAERGLSAELESLPRPSQSDLDLLTFLDLTVGPDGKPTDVETRLGEILQRYAPAHPVHQAVSRSRAHLVESATRGARVARQPM